MILKRIRPAKLVALLNPPKWVRTQFFISYIITVFLTLLVLAFYMRLQPIVPLFYSLARPAQHLVPKELLFILAAISALISMSHLIIVNLFSDYDPLIIKLFSWTTVILQLGLLLALLRIIFIVT